jgi:hypothetical protein
MIDRPDSYRRGKLEIPMQYARILALIDAELGRLQEARQLLASLRLVSETAPAASLLSVEPETATILQPSPPEISRKEEITSAPEKRIPEIEVIRPKRTNRTPRKARTIFRKPTVVAVPTALGGMVSQAPVFVPAQAIRQALAQKQQAQVPESTPATTSDPLTTELLARRWLHSSTS